MSGIIKTLNEVSLADRAYEMIRAAILDGELKPNQRFSIEGMAASLGISRTPVREALKALQGDGMVRLLPHRGAMIETYAHDEIRHRYVLAAMLEGYAALLACQADKEGLAEALIANCDRLDALCATVDQDDAETVQKLMVLNREFHGLIHEASGSPTLLRLLAMLRQPNSYSLAYWKVASAREQSQGIHRQIANAFAAKDAEAARALVEKHLTDAFQRVLRHFIETGAAPKDALE